MRRTVVELVATRSPVFCFLSLLVALVTKVDALLELIKLVFKHLCEVTRNLIDLLFELPNLRVLFIDHLLLRIQ